MTWRTHNGGACPTHEQAIVRARYRGVGTPFESRHEYTAGRLRWSHRNDPGDIIAYTIISDGAEAAA